MIEMKTRDLIGKPLNWAVAQYADKHVTLGDIHWENYCPSTDWAQGGPIIEREKIAIRENGDSAEWYACIRFGSYSKFGPTPLIAAMRCLVSAKLGDTISIPKELL